MNFPVQVNKVIKKRSTKIKKAETEVMTSENEEQE